MAPPVCECRLLGGFAALMAQGVLAVLALGILLLKRYLESPRRSMHTWSMDVSKQALGMAAAHACGLAIAIVAASWDAPGPEGHHRSSECAWYFVAFVADTTLGVLLTLGLHSALLWASRALARARQARQEAAETEPLAKTTGREEPT
ncbi:hypothetical protein H632_c2954p0, partial [Helicosporidium sp. ATCC 50920]